VKKKQKAHPILNQIGQKIDPINVDINKKTNPQMGPAKNQGNDLAKNQGNGLAKDHGNGLAKKIRDGIGTEFLTILQSVILTRAKKIVPAVALYVLV
tara:strand:+ start:453 stop:743 length:291 start_codon:yes stop_codon:yes gene_type:complete